MTFVFIIMFRRYDTSQDYEKEKYELTINPNKNTV